MNIIPGIQRWVGSVYYQLLISKKVALEGFPDCPRVSNYLSYRTSYSPHPVPGKSLKMAKGQPTYFLPVPLGPGEEARTLSLYNVLQESTNILPTKVLEAKAATPTLARTSTLATPFGCQPK